MNRTELKKVMSEFNIISNRLLQADYYDYIIVLRKFFNFIENTELIKNFIENCGGFDESMNDTIKEVIENYGALFVFSVDDSDEISEIYSIIKILCESNWERIPHSLISAYSSSNKYNDMLKEFNHRVIGVLITHISSYMKKVGIDMNLGDNITYNINGNQVNIANDNATINAVQNNGGLNIDDLKALISEMRNQLSEDLSDEDIKDANDSIDTIEEELVSGTPNEERVKTHFKLLKKIVKGVSGAVGFANAAINLLKFADQIYPFLDQIAQQFQSMI